MAEQSMPDRIREYARMACEPTRTELRRIADEIEREGKRVMDDHWRQAAAVSRSTDLPTGD